MFFTAKLAFVRRADKSLARPGWKQARKPVRDARDFNKMETRAVIKFLFMQGKAPKEMHEILTETLACYLPGRAKDLSAPMYNVLRYWRFILLTVYLCVFCFPHNKQRLNPCTVNQPSFLVYRLLLWCGVELEFEKNYWTCPHQRVKTKQSWK